jgi:8-oxo-dGTP pyrophosphatase MutT (NUDIX family)
MKPTDTLTFYFEDKPLRLTSRHEVVPGMLPRDGSNKLKDVVEEWISPAQRKGICYTTGDVEQAREKVMRRFPLVRAAGGLVKNTDNAYLFIFRHAKWDLPKGKMEKGETTAGCAVREVREECGLGELRLLRPLPATVHGYYHNGRAVLKETSWFEMACDDWTGMHPQVEEDITELRWMNRREITETVFPLTYASIRDVVSGVVGEGLSGKKG